MCKYCEDLKNYYVYQKETSNIGLDIKKASITYDGICEIEFLDYQRKDLDNCIPAHIGVAMNFDFKYCPYCGKEVIYP